jgi:hypothetical protein
MYFCLKKIDIPLFWTWKKFILDFQHRAQWFLTAIFVPENWYQFSAIFCNVSAIFLKASDINFSPPPVLAFKNGVVCLILILIQCIGTLANACFGGWRYCWCCCLLFGIVCCGWYFIFHGVVVISYHEKMLGLYATGLCIIFISSKCTAGLIFNGFNDV